MEDDPLLISLVLPYTYDEKKLLFWLQTRQSSDELDGLLELPGGKIEKGETPLVTACREFREEVGIQVNKELLELSKIHKHTSKNVIFYIFSCSFERKNLEDSGWYSQFEEVEAQIPPENKIFLKDILKTL